MFGELFFTSLKFSICKILIIYRCLTINFIVRNGDVKVISCLCSGFVSQP